MPHDVGTDSIANVDSSEIKIEIEITPEMIEAGEGALSAVLGGAVMRNWDPHDLAISVFRAMWCSGRLSICSNLPHSRGK